MADENTVEKDALLQKLAALEAEQAEVRRHLETITSVSQSGTGAIATTGGAAGGADSIVVSGDVAGPVIVAKDGATIVIGEQPIVMTAVQRESALGRYLSHVISRNRYLHLQGIRSGGRLVNIEIEDIYVTLKATRTRTLADDAIWLAEERQLAPGERQKLPREPRTETVTITVQEALGEHRRLVILGDPGSGKTTLLRYLALCYARDRAEDATLVQDRLGIPESGFLPVLLPLRKLGAYFKTHYPSDDGIEGHRRLLAFLRAALQDEGIDVPDNFLDADLAAGRVVVLFDGMDEVGDFDLRRRMARLIEGFAAASPQCRMVVTSRMVGYTDAARLGEDFATTTIRDFTLADVEQFLTHWHRLVAIGQMQPGESAEHVAASQTRHLMEAIKTNPRVRELAINPLMLTVIAMLHRDRMKLPERRAELYAEAVDVLLGKWDEARGVEESHILVDQAFDITDRRLLLQAIALAMHEAGKKDIDADDLQARVCMVFAGITPDARAAERATERFLSVIKARTGLLVEAGQGVYRFSHLSFQEYLAAVQVTERDDYIAYILAHAADPFWREVILLAAGYLSTRNQTKTTRLIRALVDAPKEPELFHNLVLTAECIRDVGPTRVEGDVTTTLTRRLQAELAQPIPAAPTGLTGLLGRWTGAAERRQAIVRRRIAAVRALNRIESGSFGGSGEYWSLPHGEPQWVAIPAGEFWMGSDVSDQLAFGNETPAHRLFLPAFQMARTPVTNGQYGLYVQATGVAPPDWWEDGQVPKDKLEHPVVGITWYDACAYCEWLSKMTGTCVCLPTEAEWEKAARGAQDARVYPWGNVFDVTKCNTSLLGLGDTTPVGVFPTGASPYGCLDMAGNVWEWTSSRYASYPYDPHDGREQLPAPDDTLRVVRGGAFWRDHQYARCACRYADDARVVDNDVGFRVVVRPCL